LFLFVIWGVLTMFYRLCKAAFGTFIVALVIIPIVLFCPDWELAPWIRLHAFSLFVGVFVLQLILLTEGVDLPPFIEESDEDDE